MKSLVKGLLGFAAFVGCVALSGFVVRKRVPSFGTSDDPRVGLTAALDGIRFSSTSDALADLSALAYFGGIEIDLTAATPSPIAVVNLRAIMGGIDVVVPSTWRVEVISRGSVSGTRNLTNPDEPKGGPLVIIDAFAVMAGIQIHEREIPVGS